jgi:hypothetical protein
MVRRRLLLSLGFALLVSIASWSAVLAQSNGLAPMPLGAPPQLLLTAMRTRIAVSFNRRSGRTIPASHCRHAPGGCEKRLAAFAEYLVDAAEHHSLDPWLMAAMAFKESGFNPFALGSLGEMGILQINPERKDARQVRFMRDEWYRKRCRKEPGACQQEVVEHAAQVLARAFERCNNDVVEALGAYNTGHCGGNRTYAKGVLITRNELREAAGYPGEQVSIPKRKRERPEPQLAEFRPSRKPRPGSPVRSGRPEQ